MKQKVYITRQIPQPVIDFLAERYAVEVNPHDRPLSREEFLAAIPGYDAVLCGLTDTVDETACRAVDGKCTIFANFGVGYNHIDIAAATRHGVLVSNTPDAVTDATADMAWALLLATARRVVEGDKLNRTGKLSSWGPLFMLGQEVSGQTLGIIGAGRIGTAFARRAKGFNMKLLYSSHSRKTDFEQETGAVFVDQDTLLRESDFVSIHVPLMPETKHLIGARELSLMKPTAILVNTSRGAVVDEAALVTALKNHVIWGAGLDVYEDEPKLSPGLADLDNVVIPPHFGTSTMGTRIKMGMMSAKNIVAALDGKLPPNCLNPEAKCCR